LHLSYKVRTQCAGVVRVVMRVLLHVDGVPVSRVGDGEDKVEHRPLARAVVSRLGKDARAVAKGVADGGGELAYNPFEQCAGLIGDGDLLVLSKVGREIGQ
jgi:hypothetical protein